MARARARSGKLESRIETCGCRDCAGGPRLQTGSLQGLHLADRIFRGDLASAEAFQDFSFGWRRVGLNELQAFGDAREPRFDRGITDAEDTLHLFDGAVR